MHKTYRIHSIAAALLLLAGCNAQTSAGDAEPVGQVAAALSLPGPAHDVVAVGFRVVPVGAPCDAMPLAETTVALEDEAAPASVLPPGSGESHAFADGLFVLPAGTYHVCAVPTQQDGTPSGECASAEGDASVFEGQTTEIALVSQCRGVANGALDVVVSLNDPPVIDDIDVEASKFITTCDQATVTVSASDVNGDALSYDWIQISGPAVAGMAENGASMTFATNVPGDYQVQVVVTDAQGGTTSLTFPIHVTEGDCGGAMQCDGGTDAGTGDAWVVCEADASRAWVSANVWGYYHLDLICQELGYDHASQFGGNCGSVCGYCDGQTSCENHGREVYDGAGDCGMDALGRLICYTVTWECVH